MSHFMPIGQRVIGGGFKPVTFDSLCFRFDCKGITKVEMDKAAEKLLNKKELFKRKRHRLDFRHPGIVMYNWLWNGEGWDQEKYDQCIIKSVPIDSYPQPIPSKCLLSAEKARDLGVGSFYVAYSVLGTVQSSYSVILGCLPCESTEKYTTLFEIDSWS